MTTRLVETKYLAKIKQKRKECSFTGFQLRLVLSISINLNLQDEQNLLRTPCRSGYKQRNAKTTCNVL